MLLSIHRKMRQSKHFGRLTALTRVLLAIAFLEPGLRKILGEPFTVLPVTDPVGYFFDAFFQAGAFYSFVGWGQVIAALLLLHPRTATLGAVMYMPIITNIAVITVAIGFEGTWVITILMALGCVYLLAWDYDRLRQILPVRPRGSTVFSADEYRFQAGIWAVLGMLVYGLGAIVNLANFWSRIGYVGFLIAAVGGVLFGIAVAWHLRQLRLSVI